MAMKYYKFVCFQLYEFNTTNSYVTNQKKLAIEKTYEFVWNSACIQKEKISKYKKKGLPLEPRYAGICTFTNKIFQTPTKKSGVYEFFI